jgi:hypothetical protein
MMIGVGDEQPARGLVCDHLAWICERRGLFRQPFR